MTDIAAEAHWLLYAFVFLCGAAVGVILSCALLAHELRRADADDDGNYNDWPNGAGL